MCMRPISSGAFCNLRCRNKAEKYVEGLKRSVVSVLTQRRDAEAVLRRSIDEENTLRAEIGKYEERLTADDTVVR